MSARQLGTYIEVYFLHLVVHVLWPRLLEHLEMHSMAWIPGNHLNKVVLATLCRPVACELLESVFLDDLLEEGPSCFLHYFQSKFN